MSSVIQLRLQDIGAWLKINSEAAYNTTCWWRGAHDGNRCFTSSPNKTFCITDLVKRSDPTGRQERLSLQNRLDLRQFVLTHTSKQGGEEVL